MSLQVTKSDAVLLHQIEHSLRGCGQAALPLLGNVLNAIHRELAYDIVVDSLSDVTAGLAKSPLVPDARHIDDVFTVYARNPSSLGNILAKQNIVDWDKRILFKPVHESLLDVLTTSTGKYGKWKTFNDYDSYFVLHSSNILDPEVKLGSVPEVCGYHMGSLDPSHAPLIARRLGDNQEDTVDYYASQLQWGISAAAYENSDSTRRSSANGEASTDPVAYCLSSDDMSLIALYVSPKHRGKGLGEWVIEKSGRKMHDLNMPAFGHIDPQNMASRKLVDKLGGLPRAGKWYWMEFVPHHYCN
jgi:GNAT superfamily N-acetyltransferase